MFDSKETSVRNIIRVSIILRTLLRNSIPRFACVAQTHANRLAMLQPHKVCIYYTSHIDDPPSRGSAIASDMDLTSGKLQTTQLPLEPFNNANDGTDPGQTLFRWMNALLWNIGLVPHITTLSNHD